MSFWKKEKNKWWEIPKSEGKEVSAKRERETLVEMADGQTIHADGSGGLLNYIGTRGQNKSENKKIH